MGKKREGPTESSISKNEIKPAKKIHPFFSAKSKQPLINSDFNWSIEENDSILVGNYKNLDLSKFDSFLGLDVDGTLIKVKGTHTYPKDQFDWAFFDLEAKEKIESKLNGRALILISNQNGLNNNESEKAKGKSAENLNQFKLKLEMVSAKLDIPLILIAAFKKDIFRKPRLGILEYLQTLKGSKFDMSKCTYIGDAAGRPANSLNGRKKDFSDTDRKFALNMKIDFFTPEEFFNNVQPEHFVVEGFDPNTYLEKVYKDGITLPDLKLSQFDKEMILLVGYPGSGKSHLTQHILEPSGYKRINMDTLKTLPKCLKACDEYLAKGDSVVIDNTNADKAAREKFLSLGKKYNYHLRCFYLSSDMNLSKHNNLYRAFNPQTSKNVSGEASKAIPDIAYFSFRKRFQAPELNEGFESIVDIPFIPSFSTQLQNESITTEILSEAWKKFYF